MEGVLRLGVWNGQFSLSASLNEIPPELYQHDQRLIRRHAPGQSVVYRAVESHVTLRTNKHGLRGPEVDRQAHGVLCLGDSFTFGAQVNEEQTSCGLLAKELGASSGSRWQGLNAGVAAFSTWQELALLRELVPTLRPAAVVLNLYYGNDLMDNARFKGKLPQSAPTFTQEDPARARARRARNTWMARNSRLLGFVLAFRAQRSPDPGMLAMLRDELLPFSSGDELQAVLPHTTSAVRVFARECQRLRVPCVVSLIPPAWVVYPKRAGATAALAGLPVASLDAPRVVAAITDAAPQGLPIQDLTPILQAEAGGELLYYRFDPHWTPAGHQHAASAQAQLLDGSSLAKRPQ